MTYSLGLADPERENALLVGIIEAISAGPELTLLAAKVAPLITAASNTDVCFVHVLDDTDRSMTLLGATPRSTSRSARYGCRSAKASRAGRRVTANPW